MSSPESSKRRYDTRKAAGLCTQCGKAPAINGKVCEEHRRDYAAASRKRRAKFIKYRDCIDCGKKLDDNRVTRCPLCLLVNKISASKFYKSKKERNKIYHKQVRERIKNETFLEYGGWICACCGEVRKEFLSLDHIYGGGNFQKKSLHLGNGHSFYSWLKKQGYPKEYQVLCMNCNFAKRYGVPCPHNIENRFVVTTSGVIGNRSGVIDVEKAAAPLGKICRYAGNSRVFWSVLLHSLVVNDLAPESIKLLALVHDVSEIVISDVPSPFKVPELKNIEGSVQKRLYESLNLHPSKEDLENLRIADERALLGEVGTIAVDELKQYFPRRDEEAENAVMNYVHKFLPLDSINSDGKAVIEFIRRFRALQQTLKEKQ